MLFKQEIVETAFVVILFHVHVSKIFSKTSYKKPGLIQNVLVEMDVDVLVTHFFKDKPLCLIHNENMPFHKEINLFKHLQM